MLFTIIVKKTKKRRIVMTTKEVKFVVTDDQQLTFNKRLHELEIRFRKGVINPHVTNIKLQAFIEGAEATILDLVADWEKFYKDVFNIKVDFSNFKIPEERKGFNRLIILAKGMTLQRLYDKCKELFPCWKYTDDDLDKIVTSKRVAKTKAYAIWTRDRQEADEELKNLSANQLKKKKISGITLEERLLYELKFFTETGKHLDINNITLCSGSVDSDGLVLDVRWRDGRLKVYWYNPDDSFSSLRSREVVS